MKCKVCGKRFRLKKENKYTVKVEPHGLLTLTEKTKYYEAFDCPRCGCQNIVNIIEVGERVTAEGEEIEEETEDYIDFEEEENGERNNNNMRHGDA